MPVCHQVGSFVLAAYPWAWELRDGEVVRATFRRISKFPWGVAEGECPDGFWKIERRGFWQQRFVFRSVVTAMRSSPVQYTRVGFRRVYEDPSGFRIAIRSPGARQRFVLTVDKGPALLTFVGKSWGLRMIVEPAARERADLTALVMLSLNWMTPGGGLT